MNDLSYVCIIRYGFGRNKDRIPDNFVSIYYYML